MLGYKQKKEIVVIGSGGHASSVIDILQQLKGWNIHGVVSVNLKKSETFNGIKVLGDDTIFEQEPINQLVDKGELNCYKHHGFWKCMDTLKDKNDLNKMWDENKAEWKIW